MPNALPPVLPQPGMMDRLTGMDRVPFSAMAFSSAPRVISAGNLAVMLALVWASCKVTL